MKRRKQGKTDYKARLGLLKSGKPRVVVRISNRYITTQYVKSEEAQDKVLVTVNSGELTEYGWPESMKGSLKSLTAGYLTGFLAGKEILNKEEKEAVLDIGLKRNVKGNRIYAVLKGLLEAGLDIPHQKDILPTDEAIKKEKINLDDIKNKIQKKNG